MRRRLIMALFGSFTLLLACSGEVDEAIEDREPPGLAAECQRIGERCVLPEGPIGVCNDTGRTDCDEPPCLACMPQH